MNLPTASLSALKADVAAATWSGSPMPFSCQSAYPATSQARMASISSWSRPGSSLSRSGSGITTSHGTSRSRRQMPSSVPATMGLWFVSMTKA